MNFFLKSLLLLLFLPFASLADEIKKIELNGLINISRGTVLNYLPLEVGEEFSQEIAQKAVESLYKTDLFSDIKLSFNNDIVEITLSENPTIKFFEFKNYKDDEVLSDKIIQDIKDNFQLNIGDIFVKKNLDNLVNQLQNLYKLNAYYNAKISVKSDYDSQNRLGIEVLFDEGDRALINSFVISGIEAFPVDEINDLFSIGEPDFFLINYFTEKDRFSKQAFDAGIEAVTSKYLADGFLDFQITDKKVNFNPKLNKLDISLKVNEGKQYKIGKISFEGDLLANTESQLRNHFDIKNNDIFYRNKLVNGVNKIARIYQDIGYTFVSVNTKVLPTEKNDVIDINVVIDSDTRVYVQRIEISGNSITQDDVIRRKFKIEEGSLYSKTEIESSIASIKRLGFFSEVDYKINRYKDSPDKVDIRINVTETKTGEFSIGLSHANATGAAINAGISQKNIWGTGNTLKAAFSNSDAIEELSFFFQDPHFNNLGHSISYGFFDKTKNAANLDTSSYLMDETGFNIGYGIPLTDISRIFAEARVSSINLKCGTDLKDTFEVGQCSSADDLDFNLSLSFSSDSLNDFYYPTEGTKTSFVTRLGVPVGDFNYYQFEGTYRNYSPIFNNKTFKVSSRVKLASGYGDDELPFFKRYFEGGSSSVRGFDFNSLGSKYSNDKPKGGELSVVNSLGIDSTLEFLGIDNSNMRGSAFIDFGTLSEKISNFNVNDFRASSGLQFSWLTPIGPIGINYAVPFIKKSSDKTKAFAFELGSTF